MLFIGFNMKFPSFVYTDMNVVFPANCLWNPLEKLLLLAELEIEDCTSMDCFDA